MKVLKYLGILLGAILLVVIAIATYLKVALPDTGDAPEITVEITPQRVERGQYLANTVAVCMDCHSTRNWAKYSGPMETEGLGGGGEVFDEKMGFPGTFHAPNITPYALGNWTDGEILRAITTGVSKDGRALFPLMGYHRFGKMDEEDVFSLIAYIRTLPPVKKDIPRSEPDFIFSFILNTLPEKAAFEKRPSPADSIAYGRYVINAAGCVECHSQTDKGAKIPGTEFGGGMEFNQPGGVIRSVNITMDNETGIGTWSKETFISKFKTFADSSFVPADVKQGELNTPMPWTMYGRMTEEDLGAIYTYLTTVKPIRNKVVRVETRIAQTDKK